MVVNAVLCLSYVMMDAGVPFQMQIEMVSDLRIIFSYDQEQFVSSNLNVNFECRNQQLCASRSLLHYWLRYENENHRGKRNLDSESANQLIIRWVINSNSFFVGDNLIKRPIQKGRKNLNQSKTHGQLVQFFCTGCVLPSFVRICSDFRKPRIILVSKQKVRN